MRKIRIGFIGLNTLSHAYSIFKSIEKQSDIFEIAGYTLPENEEERFPSQIPMFNNVKKMTLDEMMNDETIEAVAVETDEIYCTKYAEIAARHGKHIHMEKPGGTDLAEFERMIAEVKKGGKVFHTGYMYRYNPLLTDLLADIKRGELGDVISVEAQMNCRHSVKNRQWLKDFPGGMMFFLGCHLVDLILTIQGEPKNVIPLNRCTGLDGVTSEDFGMAVFDFGNAVSFAKTTAIEGGGFNRRQLVVTGTKKTVEVKPLEYYDDALHMQYTDMTLYSDPDNWTDKGVKSTSIGYDRYDNMMASFAAMVRGEKENPWNYDYELMVYRYTLKACGK